MAATIGVIAGLGVAVGASAGSAGAQETPDAVVVDAGGPYVGVVGEPIELHGTVTGAEGDIRVIWSEDAEGIPCTFADETSLDATVTCHEPFRVGIALGVEDLATGDLYIDIADILAEAPPTGPGTTTTTTTTSPSTTTTSDPSGTTTTTTARSGGQLPRTGAALGTLTVVGLVLVAGGVVAVVISRRRGRKLL
jgi:LPXTG-motif cell wall-anchored protein